MIAGGMQCTQSRSTTTSRSGASSKRSEGGTAAHGSRAPCELKNALRHHVVVGAASVPIAVAAVVGAGNHVVHLAPLHRRHAAAIGAPAVARHAVFRAAPLPEAAVPDDLYAGIVGERSREQFERGEKIGRASCRERVEREV